MKRLLKEWNACRIVRSIVGICFLVYGIQLHEWPVIIFGMAWLAVGLFSLQCCATGNCAAPVNRQTSVTHKPIEFTEIK